MTVGKSALGPIAVGVYAALNVASYSGAAGVSPGGFFDDIPQGTTTYPVSWYSLSESDGGGATFGKGGKELTLRIRGWDDYQGKKRLQALVSEASRLLHHTLPAATGFTSLLVTYLGAFDLPDEMANGQRVKALEAVFEILVEQI